MSGRDWWCGKCQFTIYGRKAHCGKCGTPRPGQQVGTVIRHRHEGVGAETKPGDWVCACGVNNFASRLACFKCREVRARPPGEGATIVTETSGECVVCMTAKAKVALLPCGHLCLCARCAPTLPTGTPCPLCRAPAEKQQVIFQ